MLYKGADLIRDVEFVIFDEVHYVNDAEVGSMFLATLDVADTYSEVWFGKRLSSCCPSMSTSSCSRQQCPTPKSSRIGLGQLSFL